MAKNISWQSEQINPNPDGVVGGQSQQSIPTNCNFWILQWSAIIDILDIVQLEVDGIIYCLNPYLPGTGASATIQSALWKLQAPIMAPGYRYKQNLILRSVPGSFNVLQSDILDGLDFNSLSIIRYYYDG